jgi:hypothetical protein
MSSDKALSILGNSLATSEAIEEGLKATFKSNSHAHLTQFVQDCALNDGQQCKRFVAKYKVIMPAVEGAAIVPGSFPARVDEVTLKINAELELVMKDLQIYDVILPEPQEVDTASSIIDPTLVEVK